MEIIVKGKGSIKLNKLNYIESGGEGKVYTKGGIAYKIYFDSTKTIPETKIKDFSPITNNNIIKPIDMILDKKNNPIGYTMRFINNAITLCQLFTKAFKERNKIKETYSKNILK